MFLPREQREELKALSVAAFGVSSKWEKFVKGVPELVTRKTTEEVPGEDGAPATTQEVTVPVLHKGIKQFRTKYYSLDEVKVLMIERKRQIDELQAQFKKMQEDKAEQERVQKLINETATGSAI